MSTTHDLIVVGAGTGNDLFTPESDGLRRAIVEPSRFGGTCLNRGCIPSKMLVVAADAVRAVERANRLGVQARVEGVDWPAIRDRVFGRIDPLHDSAVAFRRSNGIEVYQDAARFVGPGRLRVGDSELSADQIVLAAGSRPVLPPIPGLDHLDYHTSDTIMRIDQLPSSMLILGGGYIAAEMGHVFSSFGVEVTIVQRGPRLLATEDLHVAERFTTLASQRIGLHLNSTVTAVEHGGPGVVATLEGSSGTTQVAAETVLVATGRRPNTDLLDVEAAGIDLDEHGHVVTDPMGATTAAGIWSLGDLSNHFQLKHMANAEAHTIVHNLTHAPDRAWALPTGIAPHAVFSDPQVASFGLTQQQAEADGIDHLISVKEYSNTAYGWALEDTTSFVKLLADPTARTLLGAHVIGPDAAVLLQPLVQAMMTGQTVDQIARGVLYIHPALTEVVEQALLEL
ncbi:MAG: mycothione reductase [Microbacteriaceae bacterium]